MNQSALTHSRLALQPYFERIRERIESGLKAQVNQYFTVLARHGWDLNAAYPYPRAMNRRDHQAAKFDFSEVRRYINRQNATSQPNRPDPCTPKDAAIVAEMINRKANMEARAVVEGYASKLANKQSELMKEGEEVTAAEYSGFLWESSMMVFTVGRDRFVWNTKIIMNRSVLGKLFNQYPTRLSKAQPQL